MKLVPFTKDEMDRLSGFDKMEAKRLYYNWLNAQRWQDKKELNTLKKKIYRFKLRKQGLCILCKKKSETSRCDECKIKYNYYKKVKVKVKKVINNEHTKN